MKNYKGDNMKKLLILSTLTLCTLSGLININTNHDNDLKESTTDYFNEKSGIKKLTIQEIDNKQSTFNASKIYVQTGNDNEGNEYLRFATALRGNFSNVKYTRTMVGKENKYAIVETVYKGISTTNNGETISSYSNGESLFNYDITSTKDYYWACYTIKYTAESMFKDTDITINLNVDNKYYDTRTISLNDAKNDFQTTTLFGDLLLNQTVNTKEFNSIFDNTKIGNGYIQGLATDGENLFYSLSDHNKVASLRKYNPTTKEDIELIKNIKMSDSISDGGYLKYIDNKLYLVSNTGDILVYDISNNKMLDNLTFNDLTDTIIDFSYNQSKKEYIVYTKNKISFFNKNKNLLTGGFNVSAKRIQTDDNYIYAIKNSDNTRKIFVEVYDYKGNNLTSYTFENENILPNVTAYFNVSNILFLNNKFYVSALTWGDPTYSGLYEATINDYKLDRSLGEYIEINKNSGKENAFDGYRYTAKSQSGYLQGVATHGDYVYYSYTTSTENKTTIIVRSNPFTNDWKAGASTINLGRDNITIESEKYADAGRILFYNDQLWVVKYNSKELIGVDKDTLVENGKKPLSFDKLSTNIKDVKFNEFNNMFIVYGTDNYIYYFDTNLNLIEKTSIKVDGASIYVDDNYIYVSNKTTGKQYLATSIYSYSGEKISSLNIGSDKIGDTTTNPTKNYNIQAFTEYKGMLILVGLGWTSPMNGGQIYYLNKK